MIIMNAPAVFFDERRCPEASFRFCEKLFSQFIQLAARIDFISDQIRDKLDIFLRIFVRIVFDELVFYGSHRWLSVSRDRDEGGLDIRIVRNGNEGIFITQTKAPLFFTYEISAPLLTQG